VMAGDLAAEKTVAIGEPRDNPSFTEVTADGIPLGDELRVPRGRAVVLDAMLGAPLPPGSLTWYATLGEIDLYRRTPSELVAPPDPGTGTLAVVGRDGAGGVTWQLARLVVE
jgi:hypothetical protein